MHAGLIVVLTLVLAPYLAMNVVRLARGKRWAITYCHVLMEADRAQQARRREARAAGVVAPRTSAATPRPAGSGSRRTSRGSSS